MLSRSPSSVTLNSCSFSSGDSLDHCLSVKSLGYMPLRYRQQVSPHIPSMVPFASFWTRSYWRKRDRTRILSAWSACEINGETIALKLDRGRNAPGSLVQNLRAGFVPPEPSSGSELEKTSRYNFGTFEGERRS